MIFGSHFIRVGGGNGQLVVHGKRFWALVMYTIGTTLMPEIQQKLKFLKL